MKNILLAGIVLLATGTAGIAADMPVPVKAPPVVPPPSWTGCYVGAQGGFAWGNSSTSFNNGAPGGTSYPRGGLGGGLIGCNYQIKQFVLGIEGDAEGANLIGGYVNQSGGTSSGSAQMTFDASIRARFGVALWERSLLYVTGGWSGAHYNLMGGPGFGFGVPVPCCGFSANPSGWTVGVGWEYAFYPNWTARIEYRHAEYGLTNGPLPPSFPTVNMAVRDTTDAIRVGVTYKFFSGFSR